MKFFCPLPRRFAVIQMDPVGMVKHYNDPIALAEAQAMNPKKYLVYLCTTMDLATPQKPWFRFDVCPIATTLRAEDPEEGITANMAVPIYPNTSHPEGRRAISPESPFPFPNCYFWVKTSLIVRIRRKAIRYDDSCAPILSIPQSMTFGQYFQDDLQRIDAFRRRKVGNGGALDVGDDYSGQSTPPSPPWAHTRGGDGRPSEMSHPDDDVDSLLPPGNDVHTHSNTDSSDMLSTPSGRDTPPIHDDLASILEMDIFGLNLDHTVEFIPLVDLWFEVTDHLTSETIPSPVELYKERDMITRIIHDARERAPADWQPVADSGVSIDYDAISHISIASSLLRVFGDDFHDERGLHWAPCKYTAEAARSSRSGRVAGTWQKLRYAAKRLFRSPISWRIHPPCLPFWP